MRTRAVLLVAVLMVPACRSTPRGPGSPFSGAALLVPPSPAEEAHDELIHADLARADSVTRLGLSSGLASNFADDVVYLRGGLPAIRGRTAARAVVAAESIGTNAAVRWQPVRAEASADGGSGFSYGYAIYSTPATPAPSLRIDRYIAFWRRESQGWRIVGYAETYGTPPVAMTLPPAAASAALKDEPMSETEGALDAMRNADVDFSRDASARGTGIAFGNYAADDAQIFSEAGEFITGPQEITHSFGRPTKTGLVWHPVFGRVSSAGDLGFTVGYAVLTDATGAASPVRRNYKYLTVWRKQRDGRWRYVVDGGSARKVD